MLPMKVFRTVDLPRGERFDAWRDCMNRTIAPMETVCDRPSEFMAVQHLLRLGPLVAWRTEFRPCRHRRTAVDIRRSDPELLHLTLVLPGSVPLHTEQAGNSDTHHAHDLYVIDVSRPCEVGAPFGDSPMVAIGLEIPKALVSLPPAPRCRTDRLLGRSLSGRRGFGLLVAQTLVQLFGEQGDYRPSDGGRLATLLVELVTGMLAHESETAAGLPDESRERAVVLHVREHIRRNLQDPGLSPATVAAAHHLSVRQLHRLFESEEETVAGLIRAGRLDAARRDLTDPAQRGVPACRVALRWGFTSAAHFGRVFRDAHGIPPGEYRRRVLGEAR
ncbi:helix-turn-helix domain-containing protein [Streptomyces sp. NPDC057381]|uniref:helix-turn-helix domain-containing protein n=1 Tax=unclassified Streptomyces TaxID=2593676 RepID=UPI003626AF94